MGRTALDRTTYAPENLQLERRVLLFNHGNADKTLRARQVPLANLLS